MLRRSLRRLVRPVACAATVMAAIFAGCLSASAQQLTMPGDTGAVIGDAVSPITEMPVDAAVSAGPNVVQYGGAYFNPTLGAHIRARYTTQSYGQQEGTLDLGTMRLMEVDGGVAFLDGQVTMNDESRVGYNLGLGYRWLTLPLLPYGPDSEKIAGVSIWSDGQSVSGDNFFPQIGVSMELLGDRVDFRANGYIPLGPDSRTRDFAETGNLTYSGNNLVNELIGVRDTAITVGEAELAGRILDLDAWVFGGVYGLNGNGIDATGGKIGLRGYATPDLLLSIAIANDDEFDTNALFTATWFIGRTRAENQPTGTLRDRFREPVLRNNYVATQQSVAMSTGDPLRDANGDLLRVVHIDSRTGSGGDGSFENPYSELALANVMGGPEQEGDILLVHAGSSYTNDSITLLNEQRLLGEGTFNDPTLGATLIEHDVTLLGGDVIQLPATQAGAFSLAAPTVDNTGSALTAVTMADANEVNNLNITGGVTAVGSGAFNAAGTSGAGDPTLRNLEVASTTGTAVALNSRVRIDEDDVDGDGDTTDSNVTFDVTIEDVVLTDIGTASTDSGILLNADDAGFGDSDDVFVFERVTIDDVTVNGGPAVGIRLQNTNADDTVNGTPAVDNGVAIGNYDYNGGTTGGGALAVETGDGDVTLQESNLTGGATTGNGIAVIDHAGNVTVADSVTIDNVNGTTVLVDGDGGAGIVEGDVTINADITNNSGGVATIQEINDASTQVTFGGTVTSTATDAEGIVTRSNENGSVTFSQDVSIASGANRGVVLGDTGAAQDNGNMTVSFAGLDITTSGATGLTGNQGVVQVTGTDNAINTTGAAAIDVRDASVAAAGVAFDTVNSDGSATNGIRLSDISGAGVFAIGSSGATNGATGAIQNTTGDAILLENTNNVTVTGVNVDNAGDSGVRISQAAAANQATSVTLNDVLVTNSTNDGIQIEEVGDADENFTVTLTDTTVRNGQNGVTITNYDGEGGLVLGTNVTVGGAGQGPTGNGVLISESDGITTFDTGSSITGAGGAAYEVDGNAATLAGGNHTFSGDITNTAGESVRVENVDGGTVTVNGRLTDTGSALTVQNNSGGATVDLSLEAGSTITRTGNSVGVQVTGNDNTNVTVADVDITTDTGTGVNFTGNDTASALQLTTVDIATNSGTGFNATGDGTVTVGASTIDTDSGTALNLNSVAIGGAGARFDTVTVDNGTTDAVVLTDLTGGTVFLGGGSGDGAGGSITTTGLAINASDVAGVQADNLTLAGATNSLSFTNDDDGLPMLVTLNNVDASGGTAVTHDDTGAMTFAYNSSTLTIANDGANASAIIDVAANGGGAFDFLTNSLTLNSSDADRAGLNLALSSGLTDADVSITQSNYSVQNAQALGMVVDPTNASVRFELSGTTLASTNSGAGTRVGDISVSGASSLDATIVSNTFTSAVGSDGFEVEQLGSSTVNLRLDGNTITNGDIDLTSAAGGGFNIQANSDAEVRTNNGNAVLFNGLINAGAEFDIDDTNSVTPPNN